MIDLTGQVAIVTGGARRIGAEIALTLANAGCDLVVNYRTSAADAEQTSKRIRQLGRKVRLVQGDMSRQSDARELLAETLSTFGRADILVANASVFRRTPIETVTEQDLDDMIHHNVGATLWPAQSFGVHMRDHGGGSLVLIADVAAYRPFKEYAPYNAAKAGVASLAITLAKELAPSVRVNAIAPGPILFPEHYDEATKQREIERTLLRRSGQPSHIAEAVLSLVRNDFITGAILPVDGGRGLA